MRVVHPAGVDAVGRDHALHIRLEVRRGEAELAAAREPVHHLAGEHVVPAEHGRGLSDVARGQGLAHPRRGATALRLGPVLGGELLDGLDLEAVAGAQAHHLRDVAGVAPAEAHVVPHDHDGGVQPVHEHAADELLRGLVRELEGVALQEHRVQTRLVQEDDPLLGADDVHVGHLGMVHGARVRGEGHGHGQGVAGPRQLDDPAQHLAVAAVHAVEVAQGDHGARQVRGDLVQAVPDPHQSAPASAGRAGRCVSSQIRPTTGSTSGT